jgi:hypothetical protein
MKKIFLFLTIFLFIFSAHTQAVQLCSTGGSCCSNKKQCIWQDGTLQCSGDPCGQYPRYKCTVNGCKQNDGGEYENLNSCTESCNKRIYWGCNSRTGKCGKNIIGDGWKTESECSSNCKIIRYNCNYLSGNCGPSNITNSGYMIRSECQSNCYKKYTCRLGNCVAANNGEYTNINSCKANCYHYSCNPFSGACMITLKGPYYSISSCQRYCKKNTPVPTRRPTATPTPNNNWRCALGKCVNDSWGGNMTNAQCQATCSVPVCNTCNNVTQQFDVGVGCIDKTNESNNTWSCDIVYQRKTPSNCTPNGDVNKTCKCTINQVTDCVASGTYTEHYCTPVFKPRFENVDCP